MSQLRIVIADDHDVVRRGLKSVLEDQPHWEVCGEANTGRKAVELVRAHKPDIVVLDITMPELNGLEAARQIQKTNPETKMLILTVHESEQLVHDVLKAGARGYILKSDAGRDLVAAINALRQGKTFFTTKVARIVAGAQNKAVSAVADDAESGVTSLTAREREIVQLLAEGKLNKEVADILGISVKTVETHRTNIMRKLRFHSISELVRYAIRNKLVAA
ncbi:MAG: response regulator transcription factor [Verrucomicrobia bacterium]|nr:response regulator transcription factor [Verrucomicrobiota bacterium]